MGPWRARAYNMGLGAEPPPPCGVQGPAVTCNPDFKVTPLFDAECLGNGTGYKRGYNEVGLAHGVLKDVISNYLE